MNKIVILLNLYCLSLCSVVWAQTASTDGQDDTYRVYDAVIRTMFAEDKVTFDNQVKIKQLVIREETTTDYAIAEKKENWPQVKIRLPKLSDETIAGYEANLKPPSTLKLGFDLSMKYSLISKRDYDLIFDAGSDFDRLGDNWSKFYGKFPDSGGHVHYSNVGFNKGHDQALVYFVHWCGTLCGTGHYILLSKKDKVWNVELSAMTWIS